MEDVTEFWDSRYRANRIPWDLGRVPSCLTQYLAAHPTGGDVLIPGCGSGWEIRAFEDAGWHVTAMDLAPTAIALARGIAQNPSTQILLADFFHAALGTFDLIYERTFMTSLPWNLHPAYAKRMARLLKPCGLLIGYFAYGPEDEPPPYPMLESAEQCCLARHFDLLENQPSPDALPLYADERWQIWRAR